MRFKIAIFLFLIVPFFCGAQGNLPPGTYTSSNKKAIKLIEEAKKYYESRQDARAEDLFLKTLKEDPNFVEAHIGLGYLYMEQNKNAEAVSHFRKALEINPKFFPRNFLDCGMAELSIADYEGAKKHLEEYLKFERVSPESKELAKFYLEKANFAVEAKKKPVPFNPINIGPEINSENGEYFPSLTGDGKLFMFTRSFRSPDGSGQEDFYYSKKDNNGKWQPALPLQGINSSGNEGAPTISADGNYMFFAACEEMPGVYLGGNSQGAGSCDIFYAQKVNGKWTKPVNVGPPINTGNWETQPSFSSDGKTLYFIRGFVGREGNRSVDIYMSELNNGKFSPPVKLPETVNTPHDEESVFIHPDNQTLYFSSDGHPGMGGQDIFMSKRQPDGSWGKAINLGYPINTQTDENSLLVDPSGQVAYFASDGRAGGYGSLDIYQFDLPESLRPEKLTYVKGKIYNAVTKEPLEARFELIDLETQKNVAQSYSDKAGQFLVTLTGNKNYVVNVNRDGFLFYSDNFSMKGKETDFNKPFLLDIPLQPIDTGSTVELKNVFFDVNKWDLKPESKAELEKLIAFLAKNSTVKIELGGHTDNSGDKNFNKTLSSNRAKAVYDYLITNGKIDPKRLSHKGYAETKPKVPNDSPENKAKNRRTEFKVIAK